jgi:hypothetical protein
VVAGRRIYQRVEANCRLKGFSSIAFKSPEMVRSSTSVPFLADVYRSRILLAADLSVGKEGRVKKLILLTSFLSVMGTARAQSLNAVTGINSSPSLNPGPSGVSGSSSSPSSSSSSDSSAPGSTSASGSDDYVFSTFEGYKEALTTGEEQLKAKPFGVADAARTTEQIKNSGKKPKLTAGQDDGGNLVISKPHKTDTKSKSGAKPGAGTPSERDNK